MEDKILLTYLWMQKLERKMAYQAKSKIIIYVNRKKISGNFSLYK